MSSKLQVNRQFNTQPNNQTINTNYVGCNIAYRIKNTPISGAGSNLNFYWLMDLDIDNYATSISLVKVALSGITGPLNFTLTINSGFILIALPSSGVVMPPNSVITVIIKFERLISTGVISGFVKGTNFNVSVTPFTPVDTFDTNNTLTINLQNAGTPAIDPNQSYAAGSGLVSPTANTIQTFTIYAVDAIGNNLTHGGGAFNMTLTGPGTVTIRNIVDNNNGSYTASYSVSAPGSWTINVTNASGTLIRDFPIALIVS